MHGRKKCRNFTKTWFFRVIALKVRMKRRQSSSLPRHGNGEEVEGGDDASKVTTPYLSCKN